MILGTYFWSMDERMKNVIWDNRDIPTSPDDIMIALKERCCLGHPTIMMRRRVVEAIGGYAEGEDFKAVEDYDLWMRASRHFKIANLPQYLLKHRTYEGQVSRISEHVQRINAEKIRIKYG